MAHAVSAVWPGSSGYGFPRALRRPCGYEAYIPDRLGELQLTLPTEVVADASDAERAIQELNEGSPPLASLESLARLLLRAEAVASSRIEGLTVATRRLAEAQAARDIGMPLYDVTAEAVLGNIEAMALAVNDLAMRPQVALEDILAVHRALMAHTSQSEPGGKVRQVKNWIGGNGYNPCNADFVPPPPDQVPELLADLVTFINDDCYSPLVQAALVHAQFETIHPFADGNGRTGRAVIHVVLRRRGLAPRYVPPISLVLATRSRDYLAGLRGTRYLGPANSAEAQAGYAKWIEVFASAATRASRDAAQFGRQIDDLERRWREAVGSVRANSTADLLLRSLPSAPVITVNTAARLVGRSVQATNLAVEQLEKAGVLVRINKVRWGRAFEASGLLDALTRFERSLASPTGDTRTAPPIRRVPGRAKGRSEEH
ncbi:MAG TPA: Fic family protein [Chloroflexota bacterium]|nr:Fic family protein [Chloroflexota bacterium]